MKIFLRFFLLMSFCLFSHKLLADAKQDLANFLKQLSTYQANFQQSVADENDQLIQQLDGILIIMKPNFFRWETHEPDNQLLISDGEKIWMYDRDLAQVTVRSLKDQLTETPILILSGDVDEMLADYEISSEQSSVNILQFMLIAKRDAAMFNRMELQFTNKILSSMKLMDDLGQTTQLIFSDITQNHPLNKDYFQFTPPQGVDVIESDNAR